MASSSDPKPFSPHMSRGFHQLTQELAIAVGSLKQAGGNVQYAANLIAYRRGKKR